MTDLVQSHPEQGPPARLAIRVITDGEGAGIAAQWLDDRTGNPLITIIARRVTSAPWIVPTQGIPGNQLALGLATILDAFTHAVGRRLVLPSRTAGRQEGLIWESPLQVDYDALDPLNPSQYAGSLVDHRWDDAEVTRVRMRELAARIRGAASRYPTPTVPVVIDPAPIEGSPTLASLVELIADQAENTLGVVGPMDVVLPH
ncbi:MAG: hypothetical protein H3C62_05205 [Gemmatimonadaceae bacterium]|nr:hypothetical protein [Gemmatimonadaceae bacterium]